MQPNTTNNNTNNKEGILPRGDIPFGVLNAPIEEFLKFFHKHLLWEVYIDNERNFVFQNQEDCTEAQQNIASYLQKAFFETEEDLKNIDNWNLYYISMLEFWYCRYLHEDFIKNVKWDTQKELFYLDIYFSLIMGISHYGRIYNYFPYSDELSILFLDFLELVKKYHEAIKEKEDFIRNLIDIINLGYHKKIFVFQQSAVLQLYELSIVMKFDSYNIDTLFGFYDILADLMWVAIRTFHEKKWRSAPSTLQEQLAEYIWMENKSNRFILENYLWDIVNKKTKIEKEFVLNSSEEFLKNREEHINTLKSNIIWQDNVIDAIYPLLLKNFIWLNKRPTSLLFAWESGVWKTQLAIELAHLMGIEPLIINMWNLEHSSGLSMLLGSAPGYIDSNKITMLEEYENYINQAAKESDKWVVPVIVFDEIEKASKVIYNMWLELLDRGTITLLKWVTLDFSDAIIIMTSNLWVKKDSSIWFEIEKSSDEKQELELHHYNTEIKKHLSPEILNRIEKIIVFNSLKDDDYIKIRSHLVKKIVTEQWENNPILQKALWEKGENIDSLISKILQEITEENQDVKNIRLNERQVEDKILDYILTLY